MLLENKRETYCCGDDNRLIVAVLKSDDDKNADDKTLKQWISRKLQLHHTLLHILYIDELPLTANGKKDYQAVMRLVDSKDVKHV